jgi:cysteine desulfurase
MNVIYLDHAAATPMPPVVQARLQALYADPALAANPSAEHAPGWAARAVIETARRELAGLLGCAADELLFTSGATEADNLALTGVLAAAPTARRRLIALRTEHKAVLDTAKHLARLGQPVTLLEPGRDGRLTPDALRAALGPDVALVSVMLVNNETGVINDIAALAEVAHAAGALLHTDCAQAVGKLPLDLAALGTDLASFSAHKAGGPKGVGALFLRRGVVLEAQSHGGGQERGLRSGTLPTPLIAGMACAFEWATTGLATEGARIAALRARLRAGLLALGDVHENGAAADCVPHILNLAFGGVQGESLVASLGALAVSGGSACNATQREPSAVLRAMGRDPLLAGASLRFSLGWTTTAEDIEVAISIVRDAVVRLRAVAPGPGPEA